MRPDLPDYGIYPWWPIAGDEWIHPEDRALAQLRIPSERVWRRELFDGEYYHLFYGSERLRVMPSMWLSVPRQPLEIGDAVEVLSQMGKQEPCIGKIQEKLFLRTIGEIVYVVRRVDYDLPQHYKLDQLKSLQERYKLRTGFYSHQVPVSDPNVAIDYLKIDDADSEQP